MPESKGLGDALGAWARRSRGPSRFNYRDLRQPMAALENTSVAAAAAGFAQYLLDKGKVAPEALTPRRAGVGRKRRTARTCAGPGWAWSPTRTWRNRWPTISASARHRRRPARDAGAGGAAEAHLPARQSRSCRSRTAATQSSSRWSIRSTITPCDAVRFAVGKPVIRHVVYPADFEAAYARLYGEGKSESPPDLRGGARARRRSVRRRHRPPQGRRQRGAGQSASSII